jgi:hypothetical protein
MAKQGMHKHDGNDPRVSQGHNNPDKSVTVTTGTPKKKATYEEQARQHQNPDPQPQAAKNEWHEDTRFDKPSRKDLEGSGQRNGEDSNKGD